MPSDGRARLWRTPTPLTVSSSSACFNYSHCKRDRSGSRRRWVLPVAAARGGSASSLRLFQSTIRATDQINPTRFSVLAYRACAPRALSFLWGLRQDGASARTHQLGSLLPQRRPRYPGADAPHFNFLEKKLLMARLDDYAAETHRPKGSGSMVPFLLAGAAVMLGFFVWATLQVGAF